VSLGRIRDARPCIRGDPHPGEPAAVPTACRFRLVLSVGRASSSTFFGDSWPITGRPVVRVSCEVPREGRLRDIRMAGSIVRPRHALAGPLLSLPVRRVFRVGWRGGPEVDGDAVNVAKLLRVYGGCLGIERRRRTRQPAISPGKLANER
jgi:hypothetical protein